MVDKKFIRRKISLIQQDLARLMAIIILTKKLFIIRLKKQLININNIVNSLLIF